MVSTGLYSPMAKQEVERHTQLKVPQCNMKTGDWHPGIIMSNQHPESPTWWQSMISDFIQSYLNDLQGAGESLQWLNWFPDPCVIHGNLPGVWIWSPEPSSKRQHPGDPFPQGKILAGEQWLKSPVMSCMSMQDNTCFLFICSPAQWNLANHLSLSKFHNDNYSWTRCIASPNKYAPCTLSLIINLKCASSNICPLRSC